MSTFKIVITRVEEKAVRRNGPHALLEKRPWTKEELDDRHGFAFRESREKFLDGTPLKEVYGYAPPVDVVESVETQVLQQTVENLDLPAVIKAINKL